MPRTVTVFAEVNEHSTVELEQRRRQRVLSIDTMHFEIDNKHYDSFRREMADALDLIVPEDAARPEQAAATLGKEKTAVGPAAE